MSRGRGEDLWSAFLFLWLCVPRECLLELDAGIKQWVGKERAGGEDLWDPLEMGAEGKRGAAVSDLLQSWGRDWGTGFGGTEGEVEVCGQPTCFPARSVHRVPREYLPELGSAIKH